MVFSKNSEIFLTMFQVLTLKTLMKKTQTIYSHTLNAKKTNLLLHPTPVHCLFESLFWLDSTIIFL